MVQPAFCNRRYDLLNMSIQFNGITILKLGSADYCCIVSRITRINVMNFLRNDGLGEKIIPKFSLSYRKVE